MRTHVVLPDDLVRAIDDLVGTRKRSTFIAETMEERVRRERQLKAIRDGAGILDAERYAHWSTSEKVAAWIRDLRDTPSIRRDPLDEVLAGLKRPDRTAKRAGSSAQTPRRAKQPR